MKGDSNFHDDLLLTRHVMVSLSNHDSELIRLQSEI